MREQLSCSQSKQKKNFPQITQLRFLKMKQNINMKIYLHVLLQWVWNKNLIKIHTWISTKYRKICYLMKISPGITNNEKSLSSPARTLDLSFAFNLQTFCLITHLCSGTGLNWCKGKRMAQVDVNYQWYTQILKRRLCHSFRVEQAQKDKTRFLNRVLSLWACSTLKLWHSRLFKICVYHW